RVALARAIAFEAKIILLDEPLSNLDAQLRVAMRAELGDLRSRIGFTSVYVTHDQEEAFALSDRIILMRAGRIEQEGTPAEMHATPKTRCAANFLGVKNVFAAEIAQNSGSMVEAHLGAAVILKALAGEAAGAEASAICFRPIDVRLSAEPVPGQGGIGV